MKKYRTGLVVGKFCPLHRGHELVIRTALEACENLIILSYTSRTFKGCEDINRARWLNDFVSDIDLNMEAYNCNVKVVVLPGYSAPEDDAADDVQREFCADYLWNSLHTTVQAVFSSEEYGDGFARYLNTYFEKKISGSTWAKCPVDHIMVDAARKAITISGTDIRNMGATKAYECGYISANVYSTLVPRVLILGGESSGKTTLAAALAETLSSTWVPEYGRELYEIREGKLTFEDMEVIAITQLDDERHAARLFNDATGTMPLVVVCDTSPLTTLFYSKQMFNAESPVLLELALNSLNEYDAVYLCDNSIPFDQDGTRQDSEFRIKAFEFYQRAYGNSLPVVTGTVEERVKMVVDDLNKRSLI